MATAAQVAANRANAQKSTGPRTIEGKRRSSMNPLKHGMKAATLVLAHEDETGYHEIRGMLYTQYQPATPQECMLVDQLASSWWRTIRARQCETDLLQLQIEALKGRTDKPVSPPDERRALACRFITEPEEDFSKFLRYDAAIERAFYRALNNLEKLQAARIRREERLEQEDSPAPRPVPVTATPHRYKPEIGFVSSNASKPQPPSSREDAPRQLSSFVRYPGIRD